MKIIAFFIGLIFWQQTHAQWFNNISTFTTQNGLSNNTITCMQKDADGFLWIGTHEGLNRYDGTEFINVLSNNKNNLPSNNIAKICFVAKNIMAVATDAGLCLVNTETMTGKTIALPLNPKHVNTGYQVTNLLYKKNTDELWVCTGQGVFVLNNKGALQHQLMATEAELNKGLFGIFFFKDANDDVYFYSNAKTGFYYPDFAKQQCVPVENKIANFTLNEFFTNKFTLMGAYSRGKESTCLFSKKNGTADGEYLAYTNAATGKSFLHKLEVDIPSEKRFSNAFPLNDSIFLMNSYFGEPLLYNCNSHRFKRASDNPLWFTSWPDGLGATIFKDDNYIWVGTSKGLLQSTLKINFFTNNPALLNQVKDNTSLVSFNYGIFSYNKLWVACIGAGLFGLDTVNNSVQSFFSKQPPLAYQKKIISTEVFNVNKNIWLFSVYGPVQANIATTQLSFINGANKDTAFDSFARFPMKDSKGNIWATLPNGVTRYNVANDTFTNYKSRYIGGSFPLLRAGPKTEDKKGNIWMARLDTLVKYDIAKQTFSTALVRKNGKALQPIYNMASDGDDVLYLNVAGSFGMYHIAADTIDVFRKQTGIISTAINDIVSDHDGNAWIATESGLVFYNKQKKKFSSFTKADGLPDENILNMNFADSSRKVLFLGFAKTYCLFNPQQFLLDKTVPKNIITSVVVDGEPLLVNGNQTLDYQQNSISFNYTGINYNQGQQNNYACMLEGFDEDWKYPGTERKVNYINLPPGNYRFKVKSANHQGEWNEQPAIFMFTINPPFWQRLWFRILMVLVVGSAIYYFIKRRDIALQKENKIKLQMSELRMQALRAQMNPHFIFNSLNSIQSYILSNNTIDAATYLSKFAKLMRRILDQSKHNFLPLGEVMETLKMYVEIEAFRFNNEFSYSFNVEEDDDLLDAKVPPMLLQPFVENAILHGLMPKKGNKKLIIDCQLINNNVEILIDDNGIGRTQHEAKAGHTSQGEKLTMGMLESLQQIQNSKASIEIIDKTENDLPSGTTIKFILPLN